jgi:hypothetical protein
MFKRHFRLPFRLAFLLILIACSAAADEGMWLYNAFPTAKVKSRYKYTVTQPFLDHLRLSSVRMGASASFVSADGLVFTNHHVGANCVHNLSTAEHDYMKEGFYAPTREQEPRCPGIEVANLLDIRDITHEVQAAALAGMTDAEAAVAQRSVISKLESECSDAAKSIRCETVTLYSGGLYHLYKYKRYNDVRLVMAPEFDAAFFGGDPDNFTYPRYDLDITFFRVYDNGKPVHVDDYLRFSSTGVKEGDLVFISGHPGSTSRLLTTAQLAFLRDVSYPARMKQLKQGIDLMLAFGAESAENARASERVLFGMQNTYKAMTGYNVGLTDPAVIARKKAEEDKLRGEVAARPELRETSEAWDQIAAAMQWQRENFQRLTWQSDGTLPGTLAGYARTLVRLAAELEKPSDKRLRGFQQQNLPTIEQSLASTAPISKQLEIAQMTLALTNLQQNLGAGHEYTKLVLAGKAPAERAAELVSKTHLDDPAFRKELYQGGKTAIDAAADPMVVLLRQVDATTRATRHDLETHVEDVVRKNGARIAKARFTIYGTGVAPDATGTLRVSYGVVKGYTENGKKIPYYTTFAGAFAHEAEHGGKPPYQLPASYHKAKDKLDLNTVLDTVDTGDSIGGNSGSPVVNTKGELVGILFDGNIQSLPWNFEFSEEVGRSVLTDSRAVIESLRKIYNAAPLADELLAK